MLYSALLEKKENLMKKNVKEMLFGQFNILSP